MAKITDYTNPVTGRKGSLLDPKGLLALVMGAVVLLLVFGFATSLKNWFVSKLPGNVQPAAGGGGMPGTWA